MTIRNATKIVLMLPVPVFLVVGIWQLVAGEMQAFQQFTTGFVAIYTPALGAFVTGTSIKRGQEIKGNK